MKWDGSKFSNSGIFHYDDGRLGFNGVPYDFYKLNFFGNTRIQDGDIWLKQGINSSENYALKIGPVANGLKTGIIKWSFQTNGLVIDTWGSSHETRIGGSNIILAMTEDGIVHGNVGIGKTNPSERLDINGNLIADILKSRVPTGTAPLVVASTTIVDSLNAGLLDGKHASDFLKYTDKVIQTDTVKVNNDLIVTGEIYNEINHLYGMIYDSTIVITLNQDVWQQVTNTTKTLYSTSEQDGITILGDTIVFSKAGGYDVYFEFNNIGIDKKEYHYRILQKNGSSGC